MPYNINVLFPDQLIATYVNRVVWKNQEFSRKLSIIMRDFRWQCVAWLQSDEISDPKISQ